MKIKLLIVLAVFNLNVFAVEGMWEPSQMGNLKKDLESTGYSCLLYTSDAADE